MATKKHTGSAPRPAAEDPRAAKVGRLGRIHDRLLDAAMAMREGEPLDRALESVFRRARDLGSGERSEISDVLYAFARSKRRIEDLVDRSAKSLGKKLDLLDAPLRVRIDLLAAMADAGASIEQLKERDAYAVKRFPGLLEKIAAKKVPPSKRKDPAERLAVEYSLPDWLASSLYKNFGEERTAEIGLALLQRAPFSLRVNTLKADRDTVKKRIAEEHQLQAEYTKHSSDGLILEKHTHVQAWPLFEEGAIEVQDEGSQLIAKALSPEPGEVVLDACAGAGGKTLSLGASMQNRGRLIALDLDEPKLQELKKRARRAGLTNHEVVAGDFITMPEQLVGKVDRLLLDAPCTGSGVFRRHPDARWRSVDLERLTSRQLNLLVRAAGAVRPGGLVLYATCSILREENEAIVERALAEERRFAPVPLSETMGDLARELGASHQVRIGPGPTSRDPDGFFFALLRRT